MTSLSTPISPTTSPTTSSSHALRYHEENKQQGAAVTGEKEQQTRETSIPAEQATCDYVYQTMRLSTSSSSVKDFIFAIYKQPYTRGHFCTVHFASLYRQDCAGIITQQQVALRRFEDERHQLRSHAVTKKEQGTFAFEHECLELLRQDPLHCSYFPESFGYLPRLHLEEWVPYNLEQILAIRADRLPLAPFLSPFYIDSLLRHLLSALGHLHKHNLLHGDLCTLNIGFDGSCLSSSVKLLDLGSCEELGERGRIPHGTKGRREYRSYEEWNKEPLTEKIDLYALATLTYRICGPFFLLDQFQQEDNAHWDKTLPKLQLELLPRKEDTLALCQREPLASYIDRLPALQHNAPLPLLDQSINRIKKLIYQYHHLEPRYRESAEAMLSSLLFTHARKDVEFLA